MGSLSLYSTDLLSLANHFLGTFKKIKPRLLWTLILAQHSFGWGSLASWGGKDSVVSSPVSQQCWHGQSWWSPQSEPFPSHSCWWSQVVTGALCYSWKHNVTEASVLWRNRMLREIPQQVLELLSETTVQEIGDLKQGCSKMGSSKCVLQQKEHRLRDKEGKVLIPSLPCYCPWASYSVGISISSSVKWLWFLTIRKD